MCYVLQGILLHKNILYYANLSQTQALLKLKINKFNNYIFAKNNYFLIVAIFIIFQKKNKQNIKFIPQNQQTSSFNEKCCTIDQFLTILNILILFIGPEVADAWSVGHLISIHIKDINVISNLTFYYVKTIQNRKK